ncbi:dynamin family protein [Paenibacillus sp. FSL W8-0194]|uniref:dynamin family protein n=1 Tax=Paenibacillus sp. FSL W8-0194 TaxID=2921711 RepID=UPI0030DD1FE4
MIEKIESQISLTEGQLNKLEQIRNSLERPELQIAFLGEFSVGKSSLINTLLNSQNLLPTKVTESTAVVTEISSDDRNHAVIHYVDGASSEVSHEQINSFIHGNNKVQNIEKISVFIDRTKLPKQLTLIDTPGSNVIFDAHLRMSEQAIAEAEYAVYVTNKATLSNSDLEYLNHILKFQPNLIVVMNQIDRLLNSDEGESLVEIVTQMEMDLFNRLNINLEIFPVSAKTGQGVEELRSYLFTVLVQQHNVYKKEAANQRLYRLLLDIQLKLEQKQSLLRIQTEKGNKGLTVERDKLIARQNQVNALISKERNELKQSWHQILTKKLDKIHSKTAYWDHWVKQEKKNVFSKEGAQNLLSQLQNDIERDKRTFINESMNELRIQSKYEFECIKRELRESELVGLPFHLKDPDFTDITERQEEEMAVLLSGIAKIKEEYDTVRDKLKEQSNDAEIEAQIRALEMELQSLNEKLNIPYDPVYVHKEGNNAGMFRQIGKGIGKIGDIAMMLIPAMSATSAGKKIAEKGLKQGIKELSKGTVKETVKELAEHAVKKTVDSKAGQRMLNKSPVIQYLNMLSLEGIMEQAGESADNFFGNNELIKVEDEGERMRYMQRRKQLEFETLTRYKEIQRLKEQKRASMGSKEFMLEMEREKQKLLKEQEQKLQMFEQELKKESRLREKDHWKKQFEYAAGQMIQRMTESLSAWFTMQNHHITESVQKGLAAHYEEEIGQINESMLALEQKENEQQYSVEVELKDIQRQLQVCTRFLLEVENEGRTVVAG